MKVASVLGAFLLIITGNGLFANDSDVGKAAVRLKQSHVLRYYERCMSELNSDSQCRDQLIKLHSREISALAKISKYASRYNQYDVNQSSASCYGPNNDYQSLIECWESLSERMALNESLAAQSTKESVTINDDFSGYFSRLDQTEKRSVILCARGKVSINYRDTVAHNLQKGGRDSTWALKVNALSQVLLSRGASSAQWPEMAHYFEVEAENTSRLVRGELTVDGYRAASKQNETMLGSILAPERARQSEHARNMERFSETCSRLSSSIIGRAKLASTAR